MNIKGEDPTSLLFVNAELNQQAGDGSGAEPPSNLLV